MIIFQENEQQIGLVGFLLRTEEVSYWHTASTIAVTIYYNSIVLCYMDNIRIVGMLLLSVPIYGLVLVRHIYLSLKHMNF